MKATVLRACLFSLPLLSACPPAADEAPEEANLPGDIDNSTDGLDDKLDAWDYRNSPERLANNLQYRLADLPRSGKLEKPVWADRYPQAVGKVPVAWADTYWPTAQGSSNARWMGAQVKSPLEKYDAAFNSADGCEAMPAQLCGENAKTEWDQYFSCAGPAAKWQIRSFQAIFQQIDGIDNDGDGQIDECDDTDDEGAQGWWGLCHAWTPASLLEPEPQKAVTYNGQTFEVGDIKALIQTLYDRNEALMLGGRCNLKTFSVENITSANDECADTNPGALHVVLTNFIGINDSALAMDKTASYEVWNQPITGYEVLMQDKVTATRANECVGASGSSWTFNTSAKQLYEVKTRVEYLVEGNASTRPLGMSGYLRNDTYHYILELGSTGKVIGGRYCSDSANHHPDFLWAPIRVSTSSYGRNPHVSLDKVRTLINLSLQDDAPPSGNERTFENTVGAAIPDNSPAGASLAITVTEAFTFKRLSVSVDIEHTFRGDLLVELHKDGARVATLHDRAGGSAHDLVQTYTLTPAQVGGDAARGTWELKVTDTAAQDVGRIKSLKLAFAE
jgi:hypothetical protein